MLGDDVSRGFPIDAGRRKLAGDAARADLSLPARAHERAGESLVIEPIFASQAIDRLIDDLALELPGAKLQPQLGDAVEAVAENAERSSVAAVGSGDQTEFEKSNGESSLNGSPAESLPATAIFDSISSRDMSAVD